MKKGFWAFFVIALMIVVGERCSRTGEPSTETSRTDAALTDKAETSVADTAAAARAGALTARQAFPPDGSMIEIDFVGAISHIFRTDGKQMRSALIDDSMHRSKLVIYKPTWVQTTGSEPTEKLAIEKAVGGGAVATCSNKSCSVGPLNGLIIRIVDAGDKPVTTALDRSPDFDYLVPHLSTAGTDTAGGSVFKLDPDLETGDTSKDFRAFFNIDGGAWTARPYCAPVKLDPDHENRGVRHFASTSKMRATTAKLARLEFSRDQGASWSPLNFASGKYILLEISNEAYGGAAGQPHIHLHSKVDDGTVTDFPTITDVIPDCVVSTAVGCGNTQWP